MTRKSKKKEEIKTIAMNSKCDTSSNILNSPWTYKKVRLILPLKKALNQFIPIDKICFLATAISAYKTHSIKFTKMGMRKAEKC